jgi:hypothetical protein
LPDMCLDSGWMVWRAFDLFFAVLLGSGMLLV